MRRIFVILSLALALGTVAGTAKAHACDTPQPGPVVVTPPAPVSPPYARRPFPRPGQRVWVPARWSWQSGRWVWQQGHWQYTRSYWARPNPYRVWR
jgi:hypothetical protein